MHTTAGASKVFGGQAAERIPMVTTHSLNLHVTAVVIATQEKCDWWSADLYFPYSLTERCLV